METYIKRSTVIFTSSLLICLSLFFGGLKFGNFELESARTKAVEECNKELQNISAQVVSDVAFTCGLKPSDVCTNVCLYAGESVKGIKSVEIGFMDPMTQTCVCLFKPGD